jgi:hypothetical protein
MSSATVTAKAGPALQSTAQLIENVERFEFNPANRTFDVVVTGNVHKIYDLTGVTTITCVVTGANLAFTIS